MIERGSKRHRRLLGRFHPVVTQRLFNLVEGLQLGKALAVESLSWLNRASKIGRRAAISRGVLRCLGRD
eukprot:scaffold13607_cov35-Tisochrysis_lutea.AAC.6